MVQSPHGVNFEAYRQVVMGRNGMVCAGQPLAAQAGMAILQKGGNAVDAAIATAAALNVVEPNMSGIGGDGFIMIYNKAQNKIDICNATGAAPYATDLAWYQAKYDETRTAYLSSRGFFVLRFWNNQVFTEVSGVKEAILLALTR